MSTTYDLTQITPTKLKAGDIINVPYSGAAKSITLPRGIYKLEVWGGQGGSYGTTSIGGAGGYSYGTLTTIAKDTLLYCYVGGAGTYSTKESSFVSGGFNGGGKAGYYYGGSGGGGTDIRVNTDSLYARVIVAGGGGGGWGYSGYNGGVGGGIEGGQGTGYSSSYLAGVGTQTSGGSGNGYSSPSGSNGSFGVGGNSSIYVYPYNRSSGGGGGWYGGGGSGYRSSSSYYYKGGGGAGGGSGYVYTADTASNYPSGCLLSSDYYLTSAETISGNTAFLSPDGASETGHTGNGYARITVVKIFDSLYTHIEDGWKYIASIYIKTTQNLTQLEYLQSTGTQYIDTGFIPNQNTRVVMDVMYTGELTGNIALFGGRDSVAGNSFTLWWYVNASTSSRFDYIGSTENKVVTDYIPASNKCLTVDANKNTWTLGEYSTEMTYTDIQTSYNLTLLGVNTGGETGSIFKGRIYSCQIYDNDTLVRDFVPVLDGDNVACLYDKIEEKLYHNQGTNDFVAGSVVTTVNGNLETDNIIAYTHWISPKSIYLKMSDESTEFWKQIM